MTSPFDQQGADRRRATGDDAALVAAPPARRQDPRQDTRRHEGAQSRAHATPVPGEVVTPPSVRRAPAGLPARATRPNVHRRGADTGQARQVARTGGIGYSLGRGAKKAREALLGRTGPTTTTKAGPLRAALDTVRPRRPEDRPAGRRHRGVGLGRMLCWQLAVVAVVASIGAPRPVFVGTVVAAAAAVALSTVRVQGRLLYQWLASGYRYLLRPHRALLEPGDSAAADLVTLVADHGRVETVDIDGVPVAFIHQSAGIAAVLELHAARDPGDPVWRNLLSVSSLLPPPDAGAPPFSAQLIMQTTPPADLNGLRGDYGLPTRQAWVTIQVLRTADVHESAELSIALSNATQRMIRRLARDDIPIRALDREETLSIVAALAQLDITTDAAAPVRVEETWSTWAAGGIMQACFHLDGWQHADGAARQRILRRLDLIPSRGTTVAIAAQRRDRRTDVDADCSVTVRITERDRGRLENSASLLNFALDDMPEVRPERMDGDHLAALAASLPIGAGATLR